MGLVMSRKVMERVVIGPDIVVEVVELQRGKVRLHITAPARTAIWRGESLPANHPLRAAEAPPADVPPAA